MRHEPSADTEFRTLLLFAATIFTVPTFPLWGVVAYVLWSPSRDEMLPLVTPLAVPYAMVLLLWAAYGIVAVAHGRRRARLRAAQR